MYLFQLYFILPQILQMHLSIVGQSIHVMLHNIKLLINYVDYAAN